MKVTQFYTLLCGFGLLIEVQVSNLR